MKKIAALKRLATSSLQVKQLSSQEKLGGQDFHRCKRLF